MCTRFLSYGHTHTHIPLTCLSFSLHACALSFSQPLSRSHTLSLTHVISHTFCTHHALHFGRCYATRGGASYADGILQFTAIYRGAPVPDAYVIYLFKKTRGHCAGVSWYLIWQPTNRHTIAGPLPTSHPPVGRCGALYSRSNVC